MKKAAIDKNGMSEDKFVSSSGINKLVKAEKKGVFCDNMAEPIPKYAQAPCEVIYQGKNNNYIVMGRDRHRSRNTGYGGKGDTQASMIDMVVGRMAHEPKDDVWVDPNFSKDSARIYISQKTDVDKNFNLVAGSLGLSRAKSAIAMKADDIRLISREGLKIITGHGDTNSQGADISNVKYGVNIIANNDDEDLQPMPKGDNLVKAISRLTHHVAKLNGIVDGLLLEQDKLNKALKDHWHISTKPGMRTSASPEVFLVAQQTILRHFQKTKMSLRNHRTNLQNFEKNYLSEGGAGYINSRYNKVN